MTEKNNIKNTILSIENEKRKKEDEKIKELDKKEKIDYIIKKFFSSKKIDTLGEINKIKAELEDIKMDIKLNEKDVKGLYDEISYLINKTDFSLEDIEILLSKIDEINEIIKAEKLIPDNLLFTKQDYFLALQDKNKRNEVIKKINTILDITINKLGITDSIIGLIVGSYYLMDKNLVKLHDDCIDIKNSLT